MVGPPVGDRSPGETPATRGREQWLDRAPCEPLAVDLQAVGTRSRRPRLSADGRDAAPGGRVASGAPSRRPVAVRPRHRHQEDGDLDIVVNGVPTSSLELVSERRTDLVWAVRSYRRRPQRPTHIMAPDGTGNHLLDSTPGTQSRHRIGMVERLVTDLRVRGFAADSGRFYVVVPIGGSDAGPGPRVPGAPAGVRLRLDVVAGRHDVPRQIDRTHLLPIRPGGSGHGASSATPGANGRRQRPATRRPLTSSCHGR